jgi:hypothetical protein
MCKDEGGKVLATVPQAVTSTSYYYSIVLVVGCCFHVKAHRRMPQKTDELVHPKPARGGKNDPLSFVFLLMRALLFMDEGRIRWVMD